MEQPLLNFPPFALSLLGLLYLLIVAFKASHILDIHLILDNLSLILVVFDLRLEGALLHLDVLHLLFIARLFLFGLLLDVIQTSSPLGLGHQAAHFIDLWPVSWTLRLLYFTQMMLVAVAFHLLGNLVDLWIKVALSIGLSLNVGHPIGFLDDRSIVEPVDLLFVGLVLSILHH
jgi:hypothetical protein